MKEERVLPPPVGTVSEKTPGGHAARSWQASYTWHRILLTEVAGAFFINCSWLALSVTSQFSPTSRSERDALLRRLAVLGSKWASVSRLSASTRHEKTKRASISYTSPRSPLSCGKSASAGISLAACGGSFNSPRWFLA